MAYSLGGLPVRNLENYAHSAVAIFLGISMSKLARTVMDCLPILGAYAKQKPHPHCGGKTELLFRPQWIFYF
ncbi:MAG: hypothetical protein A2644_00825 [Candidatus Zambryskibacteria bacterium RIFCSPHIGHO2_01_FULL_39_63]|nr:MAG: hypothetical protein A2644_00825 [Candidatus Zambryskibacteria bacterium RIFCSPHIGHO2_01_FULL_39_63]OHA95150.1 MAG: hypothetical protein A3B88_02855 [Candidatus Zambryskibacteria bacterium RIFCSPHIGHO2_02_FULL_39_19]